MLICGSFESALTVIVSFKCRQKIFFAKLKILIDVYVSVTIIINFIVTDYFVLFLK